MAFWLQLKVLIWKNLLYRRRQKTRFCVEMIWPLFMFFVLAWIRKSGLKVSYDHCHLTTKPLLTAGLMPFIHGFFCAFNNTCFSTKDEAVAKLGKLFQPNGFALFHAELTELIAKSKSKVRQRVYDLHTTLTDVSEYVTQALHILEKNAGIKEYTLVSKDRYILKKNLDFAVNGYQNISGYIKLFQANGEDRAKKKDQLLWMKDIIFLLKEYLCNDTTKNDLLADDLDDENYDSYGDDLLQFAINRENLPEESMFNEKCVSIIQTIESHARLKLIWRVVKPFFVGKIIYTPVTNVTESIMIRVNKFFESIRILQQLKMPIDPAKLGSFNLKVDHILKLQEHLNSSMLEDMLSSESVNEYRQTMEKFLKLFDKYESNEDVISKLINMQQFDIQPNDVLKCLEGKKVVGFQDYKEAESVAAELGARNRLWGFVHFSNAGETQINTFVNYTIRVNAERTDDTYYIVDKVMRWTPRTRPHETKYISNGFIYLQDIIDHSIIQELTGIEDIPGNVLQFVPYPCHTYDSFITAISATFPFFMVMSWIYTCSMIVKSIVYEKEQRLKETMRVMGLGNEIHWIGWFIDSLLPMMFTVLMLSCILTYGGVMESSNFTIVFLFLTSYTLACIAFSFFLTVFFSRANVAAASAGIIFFFLYLPYPFMVRWMDHLNLYHKLAGSLSMNVALGLGASYIAMFEEAGVGLQWDNIGSSPRYADNYSMLIVIYTLLFDFALFLILTWYVEAIMPGKYGIPKPWYFPFKLEYWSSTIHQSPSRILRDTSSRPISDMGLSENNFEEEPTDLEAGVVIDNLTKTYSNGKTAVRKLTINFYEGQITSLLGHNGAGKTTTISILTGIYRPTSGDAYVNGYSIKRDMDKVRTNLGMCPQFNVLFNKLTVQEHLLFYGKLRGGDKGSLQKEIAQMLQDLQLEKKSAAFPNDLSGGMQRKLSIAVAYIGGAKTVILDEPTSGVDPYSRRSIWELLIKYKKDRTVILTTHYMDEADLLSDRVAIVAQGKVRCAGSVAFLKERFGKGYEITLEIAPLEKDPEPASAQYTSALLRKIDVEGVTAAIRKIIPEAKLEDHKGSEVKYTLPERNSSQIAKLCDHLDANEGQLKIASYGITDCSLEDIFLTVTGEGDQKKSKYPASESTGVFFSNLAKTLSKQRNSNDSGASQTSMEPQKDRMKKVIKYLRQFKALTCKRFHNVKRNRKAILSEWISPSLIILFAMIVMKLFPPLQERPSRILIFSEYDPPRYLFQSEGETNELTKKLLTQLSSDTGFGHSCVRTEVKIRDVSCTHAKIHTENPLRAPKNCSCSTGSQICEEHKTPLPAHIKTSSGELVIDLNKIDIPHWLIHTYPKYRLKRLGGVEMNVSSEIPNLDLEGKINDMNNNNNNFKGDLRLKPWFQLLKIWFNNKDWHSSATMLNYVNNGLLRALVKDKPGKYGIMTVNHPMNFTAKERELEIVKQSSRSILTTIAVIFAMSFVPASFTLFLIEERVTNSKHLQLSSGVSRFIYWLQTFIWDMLCFIISAFLCILLFFAFNYQEFVSRAHLPGIILLLLLYGWAIIPLMYTGSFLFEIPASAFVALSCCNVFLGVVTTIVPFILDSFKNDKSIGRTNNLLKNIFLIFPQFCLGDGLSKLSHNHNQAALREFYDIVKDVSIFDWDFLFVNYLMLLFLGVVFFVLTLCLEYDIFRTHFLDLFFTFRKPQTKPPDLDEDVLKEQERVKDHFCKDLVIIRDLYKKYKRKKQPSVRGVSLGLKSGECFGLLGINGAGKTTTFKMLTGELKPSCGDAFIKGYSVTKNVDKARTVMGYCPQFDALHPLLTVKETLQLYAEIRNVPSAMVPQTIEEMINELGLSQFVHKLAGDLSGGNKRKLSTAIALIGMPPVVFLDEPTTGMDPKSRRFLWSCIEELIKSGTCVILTSHSMEECQALCTKLTIMVNGQFQCLGSAQHLKKKYGKGYQIIIRFPLEKRDELKKYVAFQLPTSVVDEEHLNQIRYHVTNIKVSKLFIEMEYAKNRGLIKDFSVSQTTLEEVFMAFAKQQEQEEAIKRTELWCLKLWKYLRCRKKKETKIATPSKELPITEPTIDKTGDSKLDSVETIKSVKSAKSTATHVSQRSSHNLEPTESSGKINLEKTKSKEIK